MRRRKFLVTKDHYILYSDADKIEDEILFSGEHGFEASNTVGIVSFYGTGVIKAIFKNFSDEWDEEFTFTAPLLQPKENMAAATGLNGKKKEFVMINAVDSKSSVGQLVIKEAFNAHGIYAESSASNTEISTIENNPNQTVVIYEQCLESIKRSLDTHERYVPEVTNNVTEEELNIDWGE